MSAGCFKWCLKGFWRVPRECPEGVWKVFGGYLNGVWRLVGGCLQGIWKVFGRCLILLGIKNVLGECQKFWTKIR